MRAAGEGGSELARKRRVNRLLLVFEQDVCERAALGRGLYISGGGSSRDTTICSAEPHSGPHSHPRSCSHSEPARPRRPRLVFVLVVPIVFILIAIEIIEISILPNRDIAKVDEPTHGRHLGRESLVLCIRAAEERVQREWAVGLAGSRRSRGRGGNIGGLSILLV